MNPLGRLSCPDAWHEGLNQSWRRQGHVQACWEVMSRSTLRTMSKSLNSTPVESARVQNLDWRDRVRFQHAMPNYLAQQKTKKKQPLSVIPLGLV